MASGVINVQAAARSTGRRKQAGGYVEQVLDPTDTRAKIVRLNKRGVALRQACFVARAELQTLAKKALGQSSSVI